MEVKSRQWAPFLKLAARIHNRAALLCLYPMHTLIFCQCQYMIAKDQWPQLASVGRKDSDSHFIFLNVSQPCYDLCCVEALRPAERSTPWTPAAKSPRMSSGNVFTLLSMLHLRPQLVARRASQSFALFISLTYCVFVFECACSSPHSIRSR